MQHRRSALGRQQRFAAGAAALLAASASLFVMAAPAGATVYGHAPARRNGPVPAVAGTITVSPTTLTFPTQRAGTESGHPQIVTIHNTGATAVTITDIFTTTNDYFGSNTCFDQPTLAIGLSCTITTEFFPNAAGSRPATLEIDDDATGSPHKVSLKGTGVEGYYLAGAHGEVAGFGDAVSRGNASALNLSSPIISIRTTANGDGYWLLGADGGIFSYGNAKFFGSTGAIHLNKPVVGMERTETGNGYWLVASDGGIFSFGDAKFYGSTGAMHLNQPVVGMARTPTGHGYWLVARDGGIFSFGDAKFFGSTGAIHLNQPIVGMVARPTGIGYWMHASDGGIFAFGDAPFFGSAAGATNGTVTGMGETPDGNGYWLAANTGKVFHFGNAPSLGDLPTAGVSATDVVGIAPTAPPLPFAVQF